MLHEVLAAYLKKVERAIIRCRSAYVERYVEEVITPERVNLLIVQPDSALRPPVAPSAIDHFLTCTPRGNEPPAACGDFPT